MDAENSKVPKQDFDRWLDAAMHARVEAEPRPGFEERVLARLAMEPARRHFVWWPSFIAVAALVVIASGIILMRIGNSTLTAAPGPDQAQSSLDRYRKPAIQTIVVPRETRRQRTRAGAKVIHCCRVLASTGMNNSKPLPKLTVFPSPRPETEQEHLLLRLAAQQGSFEMANLNPDLPIREMSVPELKIAPMDGTPADNPPQH
jgi:hypothetical protein